MRQSKFLPVPGRILSWHHQPLISDILRWGPELLQRLQQGPKNHEAGGGEVQLRASGMGVAGVHLLLIMPHEVGSTKATCLPAGCLWQWQQWKGNRLPAPVPVFARLMFSCDALAASKCQSPPARGGAKVVVSTFRQAYMSASVSGGRSVWRQEAATEPDPPTAPLLHCDIESSVRPAREGARKCPVMPLPQMRPQMAGPAPLTQNPGCGCSSPTQPPHYSVKHSSVGPSRARPGCACATALGMPVPSLRRTPRTHLGGAIARMLQRSAGPARGDTVWARQGLHW